MNNNNSFSKRRAWVHRLCFNPFFEDALAKLRAKTGYGETYAILNSLNEFWHREGFMSNEGYEFNKSRYHGTLIDAFKKEVLEKATATSLPEKDNAKFERQLLRVARQWPRLSPKSQQHWLRKAQEYADLSAAQQILKAAKEGS